MDPLFRRGRAATLPGRPGALRTGDTDTRRVCPLRRAEEAQQEAFLRHYEGDAAVTIERRRHLRLAPSFKCQVFVEVTHSLPESRKKIIVVKPRVSCEVEVGFQLPAV